MVNSVVLVGRVERIVESRSGESAVLAFVLAIDHPTNRNTDWFRVEMWDDAARRVGGLIEQGLTVGIQGRLLGQISGGLITILASNLRILTAPMVVESDQQAVRA